MPKPKGLHPFYETVIFGFLGFWFLVVAVSTFYDRSPIAAISVVAAWILTVLLLLRFAPPFAPGVAAFPVIVVALVLFRNYIWGSSPLTISDLAALAAGSIAIAYGMVKRRLTKDKVGGKTESRGSKE